MKKTNFVKSALAALAATVLFAACSSPVSGAIDTIVELQAPGNLTAIAYPGVNYVSWNVVPGAQGYDVKKVVDGIHYDVAVVSNNYITDTSVKNNGLEVTYEVYAKSNTNPSRAVYAWDSAVSKVTVKCIFPAAGTLATDLPKYENNSGWNFDENADNSKWEKAKYVPSADTIKVVTLNDYTKRTSGFVVTSPAKRYLRTDVMMKLDGFTVATVAGTSRYADYQGAQLGGTDPTSFNGNENATTKINVPTLGAGNWTYVAAVTSVNDVYQPAFIDLTDKFEKVKTLNEKIGTNTGTVTAKYIDEGKTARVYFTPATKSDKITLWDLANYVVYREFDGVYTKLGALSSSELVESGSNNVVYYIDDNAIPSNKVPYNYYVVLSDSGEYESGVKKGVLSAYIPYAMTNDVTLSGGTPYVADTDGIKNDIKWTLTLNNKYQTFKAYLITKPKYVSTSIEDIIFTPEFLAGKEVSAVKESNTTDLIFTLYTKDVEGTAYMLVIVSEKDKKDRYVIQSKAPAAVDDVTWATGANSSITTKVFDNRITNSNDGTLSIVNNDVEIKVEDTITVRSSEVTIDSIDNYTYTLYRAKSVLKQPTANTLTWRVDSEDWVKVADLEMKDTAVYNTSVATNTKTYSGFVSESDLADGVYGYKVVKTNKKTGKFATKGISYIQIDTKSAFVRNSATISAAYDTTVTTFKPGTDDKAKINVKFRFTRNNLVNDTVRWSTDDGYDSTDAIIGEIKEYKPFVHEEGVTYTLYRKVVDTRNDTLNAKGMTEVVYEKVKDFEAPKAIAYTGTYQTAYKDAAGNIQYNTVNPTQILEYQIDLPDQDTNKRYEYLVRASKAGNVDITIGSISLAALSNK